MDKRIVFTFGTLFVPEIIEALLNHTPENFMAYLAGYSVYLGNEHILSNEIKQDFISKGRNLSNFKFLFAKKDITSSTAIEGKAYYIDLKDELILDWWERYPKWYRKENVTIQNKTGEKFSAFIYTLDKNGEKQVSFKRNPNNNTREAIEGAQKIRERIKQEFPLAKI